MKKKSFLILIITFGLILYWCQQNQQTTQDDIPWNDYNQTQDQWEVENDWGVENDWEDNWETTYDTGSENDWLVQVYYFWWDWCPACAVQNEFWEELKQNDEINEKISINRYEVYGSRTNSQLFNEIWQELWVQVWSVPTTFIWQDSFVWVQKDAIQNKIDKCIQEGCNDVVGEIIY